MGVDLIEQLIKATGLPTDIMRAEVLRLLNKSNIQPTSVSLDELRKVMADYVQDVLLSAKQGIDNKTSTDERQTRP